MKQETNEMIGRVIGGIIAFTLFAFGLGLIIKIAYKLIMFGWGLI